MKQKTSNYSIIPFNFHSSHHLICYVGVGGKKMYDWGEGGREEAKKSMVMGVKIRNQNTAFLGCLVRLHCYQNMAPLLRVANITDFSKKVRNLENDPYFSRFLYEASKFSDFFTDFEIFWIFSTFLSQLGMITGFDYVVHGLLIVIRNTRS